MPASAVIPAPIVYPNIAAVKKLVVEAEPWSWAPSCDVLNGSLDCGRYTDHTALSGVRGTELEARDLVRCMARAHNGQVTLKRYLNWVGTGPSGPAVSRAACHLKEIGKLKVSIYAIEQFSKARRRTVHLVAPRGALVRSQ